jgi:hypothetical protein
MARYSAFLGCKVEVQYRAGDILLPASGTFVADSGRSIFLEQHLTQRGQQRHFRWEIPYQYLVRLERAAATEEVVDPAAFPAPMSTGIAKPQTSPFSNPAAEATAVSPSRLLPLRNRAKTA